MNIHISKGGQSLGQFTLAEVNRMLGSGQISANDLAWQEGMPDWVPVSSIPGVSRGAPPIPGNAASPPLPAATVDVPNYLVQSILVTIFCCLPFGIPAIVFAAQVNGKLAAGDRMGALESSRKAKMRCWWAFGIGLGFSVLYLLAAVGSSL